MEKKPKDKLIINIPGAVIGDEKYINMLSEKISETIESRDIKLFPGKIIKGRTKKRLLSVEETARYLGISPKTIYNQIGRKAKKKFPIKAKRIGKSVKFDIEDINNYIKSL